jgi:hypothetical protein
MKRSREGTEMDQINDIELESKKYRQDQFLAYISHRNRDNSGAVVETNPQRHLNAIFELAFHLHLSKDTRENSWFCMELLRKHQVVVPDVYIC